MLSPWVACLLDSTQGMPIRVRVHKYVAITSFVHEEVPLVLGPGVADLSGLVAERVEPRSAAMPQACRPTLGSVPPLPREVSAARAWAGVLRVARRRSVQAVSTARLERTVDECQPRADCAPLVSWHLDAPEGSCASTLGARHKAGRGGRRRGAFGDDDDGPLIRGRAVRIAFDRALRATSSEWVWAKRRRRPLNAPGSIRAPCLRSPAGSCPLG